MPFPFRFLTEHDVRELIPSSDFPALVDLMGRTLADFSASRAIQPIRTTVPVGRPGHHLAVMPARLPASEALGTKILSVVPENPERGLPSHLGVIVLFDTDNGALRAVMDAGYITEIRTAAVSAVSVRTMARPEAQTLAIIGAGVQARSHLEVINSIRPLSHVRVWTPKDAQVNAFIKEMSARTGLPIDGAATAEQAVAGADIVVLATSSETPVVRNEWIADGTHVVAIGACRPHQREMDPALIERSRLIVDSKAAALVESGDIVMGLREDHFSPTHLIGELGEVVAGRVAGRTDPKEVTLFKSLGLAVEDVATASLAWQRAEERRVGIQLRL